MQSAADVDVSKHAVTGRAKKRESHHEMCHQRQRPQQLSPTLAMDASAVHQVLTVRMCMAAARGVLHRRRNDAPAGNIMISMHAKQSGR